MLYDHPSPGGLNRRDSDRRDTGTVAISGAGFRPARSVGGGGLRFRFSIGGEHNFRHLTLYIQCTYIGTFMDMYMRLGDLLSGPSGTTIC